LEGHDIYWIAPERLNLDYYSSNFNKIETKRFDESFFRSVADYSRLILDPNFYNSFNTYSHILICQTDAIVLKPELHLWINQPYDYVGAPWLNGWEMKISTQYIPIQGGVICRAHVGNGGLSLRRIGACVELFKEYPDIHGEWYNNGHAEDLFFSFTGFISKSFKIPNLMIAAQFSHEVDSEILYKLIGNRIPFGAHGHDKYENIAINEYIKEKRRRKNQNNKSVFSRPILEELD
jgi:hypothetical protein